jgi:glycosyltransferase involved in cell wall biosynthesis
MKIGIIVSPYEEKNASGIALCILEQVKHLLILDKSNEYLIYTSTPFKKERLSANAKNIIIPKSFFGKNFWFLRNAYFNKNLIPDILIFNMPLLPLILPKRIKAVPVFYEPVGGFETGFKQKILNIFWSFLTKISLKRSSLIITPSHASKSEILGTWRINFEKIKIIHLGFQDLSEFKKNAISVDEHNPYFLFVGKVKFKKNVHGIVEGFIKFKEKFKTPHKLLILGDYGGAYYEKILKNLRDHSLENEVMFKGYIYDKNLYEFYKNARALVFSTLREGFGMPIIEAMSLGVPVITSNLSCMPEVADGAALLVDPHNPSEIADAMAKIAFNGELREDLVKKGIERAKQFSWEKHASKFLEYINSL